MPLDAKAYLADMTAATDRIAAFTKGKTYNDYLADDLLRSGVERQFEIVGEALRKLSELNADMAAKIPEFRRIIAFRNVLVHGYASVDHWLVWGIVEHKLPGLRAAIASISSQE
jgi:uncharacterized protein with HEPN domain